MLDKLIQEGEDVRKSCFVASEYTPGGGYLKGQDYEKWIAKSILFLEKDYPGTTLTSKFISASERAVGNEPKYYETMMGILVALKESA